MCGIFGYSGKNDVKQNLLRGLGRLEYRGYDSWGVAYLHKSGLVLEKEVGKVPSIDHNNNTLSKSIRTNPGIVIGIAHTRWATHGGVTKENAHPHLAKDRTFALAQNGIVENYQQLKKELSAKGHQFISETDTEVIVRLIEEIMKNSQKSLLDATVAAFIKLEGRNTIILCSKNGELIAIRNGSPLVAGQNDEHDVMIGSDYLSFADKCNHIIEVDNDQGVFISNGHIKKFTVDRNGKRFNFAPLETKELSYEDSTIDKHGYTDFMLKEIHEQPRTILDATSYTYSELKPLITKMRNSNRVYIAGCGTAAFAASQIAYMLRKFCKIEAIELKAYEIDSYTGLFQKEDILLAISQSGETADTIEGVETMQNCGGSIVSLVNMQGSTLSRMSDFQFMSRTGPEICVASTKAFTAQISFGYLLSQSIIGKYEEAKSKLTDTSVALSELINRLNPEFNPEFKDIIKYLSEQNHAFVLGRGQNYQIALEGALKVKEITYKHFEGFAAGELKHGVIALIDKGTPVFSIISNDNSKADMLSATAEVKARGAKVIAIAPSANELYDNHILTSDLADTSPILNIIPFQLISYYLGKQLGNDVDRPRNLAKSVTVK